MADPFEQGPDPITGVGQTTPLTPEGRAITTLKAQDAPGGWNPTYTERQIVENKRAAEDAWREYRTGFEQGGAVVKSGVVYRLVEEPGKIIDYDENENPIYSTKWAEVPDPEGQKIYDDQFYWDDQLDRYKEDKKFYEGAGGAAKSYAESEEDKSAEITRQFKDFSNRANLFSDLLADEQTYGMNADDQNIANEAAIRKYGFAEMPSYTHMPMADSLSSILRPSLPDYVRPDYRLNASVGLPGPQGFDDPNYGADGLPMYAMGTNSVPDGYRIPYELQPKNPWPWGNR